MAPDVLVVKLLRSLMLLISLLAVAVGLVFILIFRIVIEKPERDLNGQIGEKTYSIKPTVMSREILWTGPSEKDIIQLPLAEQKLVSYGKNLIVHTADYLGPQGEVQHLTNGMNCQNCHLDAGTRPWGNNYFAVEATYPRFRPRSGQIETKVKRINDCFERSLNGRSLDPGSTEMKAILAYIKWIGTGVPAKKIPAGAGIYKIDDLDRAANPVLGKAVYEQKCQSCHQPDGGGVMAVNNKHYSFPPLWGTNSYNTGAGLYRLSNLAGYVKVNMPLDVTYATPQLSDEEAWDVAAFINSMPRPEKDLRKDWPNKADKPFDHPFGPYADSFTEEQHKYGPFKSIKDWKNQHRDLITKPASTAK